MRSTPPQTQSHGVMASTMYGGLRYNSTAAAGVGTRAGAGSGPPRPPQPTLRTHPWRFITTFAVVHPLLHYTLFLPPIYLLCSQTGFATWLLAGPSGAALLRTTIPDWVPNGTVYGLRDCRERVKKRWSKRGESTANVEAAVNRDKSESSDARAGLVRGLVSKGLDQVQLPSGLKAKGQAYLEDKISQHTDESKSAPVTTSVSPVTPAGPRPTIEDWMETTIYKSLSSTIRTGKSLGGLIRQYKGSDKPPPSLDEIRKVKDDEVGSSNGGGGYFSNSRAWVQGQVKDHAQDVRIRSVVDGLTAWLLVKALFPLRLPVSMWITPRVVRMMMRR